MDKYDEFMFNPSAEFDEQIEEFKDSLRSSVKVEFLERIAELEKELAELRELKENWEEKVNALEEKRIALEAKSRAIEEAKTMRLSELLSDCFCGAWGVAKEYYYSHEKCDKCDEDGRIVFKSPQGNNLWEICNCRKMSLRYVVKEAKVVSFTKKFNNFRTIFKYVETEYPDGVEDLETISSDEFADNKKFEDIMSYNRVFQNRETAQAYCNWLNQKQEEN